MKKSAKLDSSFGLLLKQGFRGLFKFKVQFSIILILSFLATLILTISVGTTRHLQANYNRIVNVVPRFAYSGTTQIGKTATGNSGAPLNQYEPIPLVDFANNAPVSALMLDNETRVDNGENLTVTEATSSYNFILNDDLYQDQLGKYATTFITKFMKDNSGNGFYELTNQQLTKTSNLDDDQYILNVARSLAWRLIQDIHQYQQSVKTKSLVGEGNLVDFADLSYLETTSVAFLVANQPNYFEFLKSWLDNNPNGPLIVNGDFFDQLPYYQKQFIDYAYWNGILFGSWIASEFKRYVKVAKTTPTAEMLYQHFLGVARGSTEPSSKGYYLKAAKGLAYDSSDKDRYLVVAADGATTDQKKIDEAIVKKSFKGMTSPLVIMTTAENNESKISNVVFTNFYQGLSLEDPTAPATSFNKELDWSLNFNTIWNPAQDNHAAWVIWENKDRKTGTNAKATIYQYHLQLTALASGYDITFRKESLFFDMISSRKFRYIVQNGFDQANFTMLEGTGPSAVGEVAISEQFARANKVKIGDYLAIGQTEVMVVGYATDAFSFMPIVDTTVPIPEPKTGAFVYGSAQTLKQINDGFGGTSKNQDLAPNYYNFFLTDRANTWTKSDVKNKLFNNLQMDLSQNLGYNLANLQTLKPIYREWLPSNKTFDSGASLPIPPRDVTSFWGLNDFASSPYASNWTILPLTVKILKIATYIASAVIALIALIALIVCINKTIVALSKQMGILKALGLEPGRIAVTYLAYGLVIMFLVVPLAWGIGLALEIPFILLFGTYFSIELLSINVAWQAFLIAFFGFGILALLVSLITAYLILLRPVLEIFDVSAKWSNSRFFDFLRNQKFRGKSFNVRFSLTLASAGIRPILLLTTVIFLTSLLISGSLTIPAIANGAIEAYYKNVLYANSYTNMAPTVNSPLSKPALTYWEGNEVWDNDWVPNALKLDSTNTKYGYYKEPTGYTDSISQNNVVPRYLYKPDVTPNQIAKQEISNSSNLNYSYVFIVQNQSEFLRYVSKIFGDNFFTVLGQGFSIGTVDQFLGLILNADKDTLQYLMGKEVSEDEHSLDWYKQQYAIGFMDNLAQGLPNVISQIIGAIDGSIAPGNSTEPTNWKDQIINAILTQVPPYIRNYIYKSPSRTEQFGIMYNSETYTPKRESVFTEVLANSATYQDLSLIGLEKSQTAFSIPANLQRNIFLEAAKIADIKAILAGNYEIEDISLGNVKIWDKQNQVLTIPFIDNQQARSGYHFDKSPILRNIKAFGRQLKYHTNGGEAWEILPREAWIYDDSDFFNSDIYQKPGATFNAKKLDDQKYQEAYQHNQAFLNNSNLATTGKNYLDLYALDNSKFTYSDLYNDNQQLNTGAYMFNDFGVDDQLQLASSYVRPYYMYKNIQLYLPMNKINPSDILASMTSDNQGVGATDLNGIHPWYEVINSGEVPQNVQNAWGNSASQYLMIRPYDLSYVPNPPKGIERITNGDKAKYWLRYAYDKDLGPGALTYENHEQINYGKYGTVSPLTINLENVGTLNSYNSRLIIIDALFANLLNNYSTARAYGYQNSFFSGPGKIDNSSGPDQPWPDKLRIYPLRDVAKDIYVGPENLSQITYLNNYNDANNLAPLRWNSGKYSNIVEPESLTSSVSFNVIDNLGQYSLGLLYPNGLGMTTLIKDQMLLSTQRALINQIFTLSISLAALLIIAIVITGSLLIMLMGDIYIAQYQNFMILMRALGYANWEIQAYAFSVVSIFAFVVWIVATIVAWAIVFGIIRSVGNRGLAIPYGLSWWPIIVSFLIIVVSFFGSLWVSSYKVRHDPVSILMSEG